MKLWVVVLDQQPGSHRVSSDTVSRLLCQVPSRQGRRKPGFPDRASKNRARPLIPREVLGS